MKKILFICFLLVSMMMTRLMAQPNGDGQVDIVRWEWTLTNATTAQIIKVPSGRGSFYINKLGSKRLNILYTNEAGQIFDLSPVRPGTDGAPELSCKLPLTVGCFASKDKKVGLCICKLSDSGETYTMTLKFSPWIVRNK